MHLFLQVNDYESFLDSTIEEQKENPNCQKVNRSKPPKVFPVLHVYGIIYVPFIRHQQEPVLLDNLTPGPTIVTVEGSEDGDIPSPFPFPSHYQSDIELGLKLQKMTPLTLSKFLTRIANVMFMYKRYPKRSDFESVANEIVDRYPFMKSLLSRMVSSPFCCTVCIHKLL